MAEYVRMPKAHYEAACNSIRAKTGKTDLITSGVMSAEIDGITGGGGGGGSVEGYATVTFMNGGDVLFSRLVMSGDDCPDPYVQNRIELPTKESTAQYTYTFNGWATADGGSADSNALKGVTVDKVLYAAYNSAVRYYTISFYDGDTLLTSKQVGYGSTPAHEATKSGYSFSGWTPTPVPVTGDASYYATWIQKLTFAGSSWSDISDVCEAGEASQHFKVGDTRTITAGDYTYVLRVVGIDLDVKADGSGKAGLTVMVDSPATDAVPFGSANMYGAWALGTDGSKNTIRSWLSTTFFNRLSEDLRSVIKLVTKTTKYKLDSVNTSTVNSKVFLPSLIELGGTQTGTQFDEGTGIKYPYFTADNKRRFYDANNAEVRWWTRVTCYSDSAYCLRSGQISTPTLSMGYFTDTDIYARPFFCI